MLATILTIFFSAVAAATGLFSACHILRQKRMADPSIIVLSRGGAWEKVAIKNMGEADAKNISVSFPESLNLRYEKDALSAAILSKNQQFNISLGPFSDERNIRCTLEWDDKMGHHKKIQSIQIL